MKIPRYVSSLPFPFDRIFRGCTFNQHIFIKGSILKDLRSNNPSPESIGILLHEQEHRKRIKMHGKWKHAWKFWTSPKFRFQEEIVADTPRMKYLKDHNAVFNIEKRARHLNGPIYLWCASFEEAKSKLTDLWNQL